MSISDKRRLTRSLRSYLLCAAGCGAFSFVYERFSHGVYSPFMVLLFLVPLLGAVPALALTLLPAAPYPCPTARGAWRCAVATLGVGSCLAGVFAIYGTAAPLVNAYWAAAGVLLAVAALAYWAQLRRG